MQSSISHRLGLEEFPFWTKTNVHENDYKTYVCILAALITLEYIVFQVFSRRKILKYSFSLKMARQSQYLLVSLSLEEL